MSTVAATTDSNQNQDAVDAAALQAAEEAAAAQAAEEAAAAAAAAAAAVADDDDISDEELDGRIIAPSFIKTTADPADAAAAASGETVSSEELARLRQIEQDYNAHISDPLVEAALNFRRSGGTDVLSFVSELTSGYKDVSKMSMDEMYETHYRNTIAKRYNLSEDDIEEALDEFKRKSPAIKAEIVDPIREKLEEESKKGIKSLSDKFAGKAKDDEDKVVAFQERERKSLEELDSKLNALVGKTLHRVPVTADMAKQLREAATKFAIRNQETLEADVDATISMWTWMLYGEKVLKQHIRYGQNRGLEASVIGRSNGNASPIKTNSATQGAQNDKYETIKQKSGGKLPRTGSSTPTN